MAGTPSAARLDAVVDSIDDAIRQIRTSIFQLRPHVPGGAGLRAAVLEVVTEVTPALGFDPFVHFSGPVDVLSDEGLAEDVTAVVREAVTNAAKHAAASRVDVGVGVSDSMLVVTVEDDGVGVGKSGRRSGLSNLGKRAQSRAGQFVIEERAVGGGTVVRWSAALS